MEGIIDGERGRVEKHGRFNERRDYSIEGERSGREYFAKRALECINNSLDDCGAGVNENGGESGAMPPEERACFRRSAIAHTPTFKLTAHCLANF
ncbi:MAG: hypothetical protein ACU833_05985 [Gammaproteobacteria bacterium]